MTSAINVSVDKGFLRVIGEVPVASSKAELEAFVAEIGFEFETIAFPSEMHMWEGLLFMERQRRIFFSSDLMFRMGETHGQIVESSWADAIKVSGVDQMPAPGMRDRLEDGLRKLTPSFVASGHGPCIRIVRS